MFEFEWRATYCSSLRAILISASLGIPIWVWPSMNRYRMFFIKISTLPPRIQHRELPTWKVLYAKQITSQEKSCWVRGWLYCILLVCLKFVHVNCMWVWVDVKLNILWKIRNVIPWIHNRQGNEQEKLWSQVVLLRFAWWWLENSGHGWPKVRLVCTVGVLVWWNSEYPK